VDPARHLAGGFVRESHGQDAMGRDFVDGDSVCDGCGQGRRFAGASARQHEDRSGVGNGDKREADVCCGG
jgi:hypothetical protein